MAQPYMQVSRFRSELNPGRGSWIAVLTIYLIGAIVTLGLVLVVSSFARLESARLEFESQSGQVAAIDQLLVDLSSTPEADERGAALEAFESAVAIVRPREDESGGVPTVGKVAELARGDASAAQVSALAMETRSALTRDMQAAAQQADELTSETRMRFLVLAFLVLLGIFGGGLLFLNRSRHLERLLSRRAEELDEVDASRRLFFAKASHELRTPVTAIRGEAEVALADGEDVDTLRLALQHVSAHARFLDHRIEEMIGIARTSDGKLHLVSDRIDLREVTQSAVKEARIFASSVEVELDLSLPDTPLEMVGDAAWLKRALLAVIENALKFSPMEGRVSVILREKDGLGEVTVSDQGPGVMPEELPLIFDAYYQTDRGKARGGTGLGLAMTRWVAEQHGGKAYARNLGSWQAPQGCSVTVAVDLERAA